MYIYYIYVCVYLITLSKLFLFGDSSDMLPLWFFLTVLDFEGARLMGEAQPLFAPFSLAALLPPPPSVLLSVRKLFRLLEYATHFPN